MTMPTQPHHYITSSRALSEFCEQLKDCSRLALPAVLAGGALDVFWEIMCNPAIQKVVHAGRQDLDLFAVHAGQIPKPFFDTQIAAAMVGFGPQIAYANLVQRVHGMKLDKAHTFTNWSARPLSQDQLAYALEDVTFLLAIHDHLHRRLSKLGRLHWAHEEFSRLEGTVGETRREPQERYQRIRGWDTLKPKSAAVLRELAAWREGEAKRRNVPRGRVMRDEVLLQLARHPPRHVQELRKVRGLHGSESDRNGETLVATIQAALSLPPSAWPEVPKERKSEPESTGLVELLQAVVKARATEEEIAPTLLATTADLQVLVDAKSNRADLDLPLLKGWRRILLGELLLEVLDGKLAITIDPKSGTITWSPPSN
ncbi:MAG: ribonuclease D [Nitrospirae bacterium]|nr:ribonuclease D [Nitrospirota bacterium]